MLGDMSAPLAPPSFWILTVLASHRRHGYDILQAAATASDGRVSLKVPTLYAALERLEADGSIRADGEEIVNGRARRYFVITDEGAARLSEEVDAMEQAARAARVHLTTRRATFAFARAVMA
jgi:PadR family transcriptional regulator PadR